MQNLLILTDFSEASSYAATYGCLLARQLNICDILLYHSTEAVISPGDGVVYSGNEQSLASIANEKLAALAASLKDQAPQGCMIRYRTDDIVLEKINDVIVEEGSELIVMGTTGKTKMEEMVTGSHAVRVFEVSDIPVVLVPAKAVMHPVGNIVFACDLKNVRETLPAGGMSKILDAFHVPLSVVHAGDGQEFSAECRELDKILEQYHPQYRDLDSENAADNVLSFADNEKGSLIMLVAKRHSFPMNLFHSSFTKKMVFDSPLPLLIFREAEKVAEEMPLLEV